MKNQLSIFDLKPDNSINNVLSLFDGISCGQIALQRAGIEYKNYFASEVDKYAIKVTQKNFPNTIQIGDITQVKSENLPKIDLLIGGSPCFIKDTMIITSDDYKPIQSILPGDYVLTHKNQFKKVLRIGNSYKETIKLKAQGFTETITTKEHPYLTRSSYKEWDNKDRKYKIKLTEAKWKEVGNLTKNNYIGLHINQNSENPYNLTDEECYILGRYIANGHTRKDKKKNGSRYWQLILSIGTHKLDEFKSKIKENHFSAFNHSKSTKRVVFSNKRLVNIAEKELGINAINKKISQTIINLPINKLSKVIDGYLSGDGSVRNETYRATTISKTLVQTLSQAIAKVYRTHVNIEFTKRPKKTIIEGRLVNQKDNFTISFKKFKAKGSRSFVIDNIIWLPIKSIEETNQKEIVFNLEVEDDNSYTANNAIVHNCQGFSFAGKQLNFEDPRSKLFFEFVRLKQELNPKFFLLENVKMKKEYQDIISQYLGVAPIEINSNLVSAQNRKRLYWTNIPGINQPEDKGILLKDIIHEKQDINTVINGNYADWFAKNAEFQLSKKYCSLSPEKAITMTARQYASWNGNYWFEKLAEYIVPFDKTLQILDKEVQRGKVGYFRKDSQANRVYYIHDKALTGCSGGGAAKMGQYLFGCITPDRVDKRQNGQRFNDGKKFYTLTAQDKHGILIEGYIRKLTPIECERLQTLPDNYTEGISNSQRYKCLGNGWTVDVISHIFKNMKEC